MWKCVFLETTGVGVGFGRDAREGEFLVRLKPSMCGSFNDTPGRYQYVDGVFSERDAQEWEAEKNEKIVNSWRANTSCGPLQMRRALRASGLLDVVNQYLETADEEVVEAWEYATKIDRDDPFILAVQQLLNKTDEEVDNLFKLALTYP